MGASDWAGDMDVQLAEEFGTSSDRNLRITSLIRWFAADPDYEGLFDGDHYDERQLFIEDLPAVLRAHPGTTLEERWNNLMDELGYQERVSGDVYLKPWSEYEVNHHELGVCSTPPEHDE